jgi:hypothetical protein
MICQLENERLVKLLSSIKLLSECRTQCHEALKNNALGFPRSARKPAFFAFPFFINFTKKKQIPSSF